MPNPSRRENEDRRGPEPIAEILSRLFVAKGWGRKQDRLHLEKAWVEAVGQERAAQTRVGTLRRGILEITVGNGPLMQELASFHKKRLLEELRKLLPSVKLNDLRFRAGVIDH
jgi:hypothetical protein